MSGRTGAPSAWLDSTSHHRRRADFMKTLVLLGAVWAAFPLRDATGALHQSSELQERPLTVLVFLSTECPLCNRAIPDLNALAERQAGKVRFFAVNAERDRTADEVLRHDRE